MYLYPQDHNLLGICILIPAIVEFLRIFIAFLLAAPPSKIRVLEKEKLELQLELASIKSIQLELVRHSKLERKVIKIVKELEGLKNSQQPKADQSKKWLRVVRLVIYAAAGVFLGLQCPVSISPSVLWPISWISSEPTVGLHAWFIIFVSAAALRHVYRTVVPLVFRSSTFP